MFLKRIHPVFILPDIKIKEKQNKSQDKHREHANYQQLTCKRLEGVRENSPKSNRMRQQLNEVETLS